MHTLLKISQKHSPGTWRSLPIFSVILTFFSILLFIKAPCARGEKFQLKQYKEIEAIIKNLTQKGAKIGCQVVCLKNGNPLCSYLPDEPLIPASNLKLLTTAVSFIRLGTNYRFKTGIYTASPLIDGILQGDLYIKGFGDPFLVNEQMWMLTHELALQGLKKIQGDIIADETFFALDGFKKQKPPYWFNAEPGALSFNFNTITLFLKPCHKPGQKAVAKLDPQIPCVRLINETTTIDKGGRKAIRVLKDLSKDTIVFSVKGKIPLEHPPVKIYRTINDPAIYTAMAFKEFLMREGISVNGEVRKGKTPDTAIPYYIHKSKPLSRIVLDLNKISNNFIAEQILMTMGAEAEGPPGTYACGLKIIKETLTQIGCDLRGLEIFDGSGLSPLNRVPARLICNLLLYMANSEIFAPEFMASLAIPGQDGSMKERAGNGIMIRAKTGRINGVSTLSGYLWNEMAEPLIFSILMNGHPSQMKEFIDSQDKILSILHTINDLNPQHTAEDSPDKISSYISSSEHIYI